MGFSCFNVIEIHLCKTIIFPAKNEFKGSLVFVAILVLEDFYYFGISTPLIK